MGNGGIYFASSAGGSRIAQRVQSNQQGLDDGLYYFLTDHLGSTAITLDNTGDKVSELRYDAWGETRYNSGTTPTRRQYTGQLAAEAGLYFYNARYFDPQLGRWIQPDSLVPIESQGLQAWDRFAYTNNNPAKYTDPSGHDVGCSGQDASECGAATVSPTGFVDYYGIENPAAALDAASQWYKTHPNYDIYQDSNVWTSSNGYLIPKPEYEILVFWYGVEKARNGQTTQLISQMDAQAVSFASMGGTYVLKNSNSEVVYVGRTNDLSRRELEHYRSDSKGYLKFEIDWRTDSYAVQRGREQQLFDYYKPPLNKIKPINDRNPNKGVYIYAASNYDNDLP